MHCATSNTKACIYLRPLKPILILSSVFQEISASKLCIHCHRKVREVLGSIRTSAILTEIYRGFLHLLQENAGIVPRLGHYRLVPSYIYPLQLIDIPSLEVHTQYLFNTTRTENYGSLLETAKLLAAPGSPLATHLVHYKWFHSGRGCWLYWPVVRKGRGTPACHVNRSNLSPKFVLCGVLPLGSSCTLWAHSQLHLLANVDQLLISAVIFRGITQSLQINAWTAPSNRS